MKRLPVRVRVEIVKRLEHHTVGFLRGKIQPHLPNF